MGSNKSEKRKPKSAVYRRILASVVYFHLRIISAKNHKRKMTRNAVSRKGPRVRIPDSPPSRSKQYTVCSGFFCLSPSSLQLYEGSIFILGDGAATLESGRRGAIKNRPLSKRPVAGINNTNEHTGCTWCSDCGGLFGKQFIQNSGGVFQLLSGLRIDSPVPLYLGVGPFPDSQKEN